MFDWEDYFKLAKLLCESKSADFSGVEDARFRSAASRAYFSTPEPQATKVWRNIDCRGDGRLRSQF